MTEPKPKKGHDNVYPVAKTTMEIALDAAYQRGLQTYGTPLQTFNGRDPYNDAREEIIDLWQYITQADMEHQQEHNVFAVAKDLFYVLEDLKHEFPEKDVEDLLTGYVHPWNLFHTLMEEVRIVA